MVSRSRSVIEPLLRVSKSTVIPNGVPSSSFLAYLLPIDAPDESRLLEIPRARRRAEIFRTNGLNCEFEDSGTISTLVGATERGNERTFIRPGIRSDKLEHSCRRNQDLLLLRYRPVDASRLAQEDCIECDRYRRKARSRWVCIRG
jgi:hypothetical protein